MGSVFGRVCRGYPTLQGLFSGPPLRGGVHCRFAVGSSGGLTPSTAASWPGSGSPGRALGRVIDRTKVWTLVPALRMFIANWFVTEDHALESGLGVHDNIDIGEACALVGEVPEVSKEDLDRIVRPERCLTLDQIDRHPVLKVMGKRADETLRRRA